MGSIGLPTARADWQRMGRTTRLVLGQPWWFVATVLISLLVLSLLVVPLHLGYVQTVIVGGSLPLVERAVAMIKLYPLVGGGDALRGTLLYAVSGTIGVNLALFGYHLLEHDVGVREGSGSTAGAVLAGLGAGCPACGAGIVAGGVSIVGVTGSLAALPLHGLEFLLFGIGTALLAVHWTVEGMRGGEVRGCPIDPPERVELGG
jgi:hypothetical protein